MHSDLGALDVVCRHYRTEYSSDALRRARNTIKVHKDVIKLASLSTP